MISKSRLIDECEFDIESSNIFEQFDILIDSLNDEGNLTFTGQLAAEYQIRQHLKNNILINNAFQNLTNPRVSRPIFVIGLPRSGTTFLFNLLSKDKKNRSPLFWEMTKPFPLVHGQNMKKKLRVMQSELLLFFKDKFIPNLDELHTIHSESPEECLLIKIFALQSIFYFYMANTPTYLDYLSTADTRISYDIHYKFLSLLETQHKPHRWLLKDPSHLGNLEEVLNYYPDASFVHITRDPVETIPSVCSLTTQVRKGFSKDIDLYDLGSKTLKFWSNSYKKNEIQKNSLNSNCYFQIKYTDFIENPIDQVKDIYRNFNISLDDETEMKMKNYLDEGLKENKRKHIYTLEDYGLVPKEVHNTLFEI